MLGGIRAADGTASPNTSDTGCSTYQYTYTHVTIVYKYTHSACSRYKHRLLPTHGALPGLFIALSSYSTATCLQAVWHTGPPKPLGTVQPTNINPTLAQLVSVDRLSWHTDPSKEHNVAEQRIKPAVRHICRCSALLL